MEVRKERLIFLHDASAHFEGSSEVLIKRQMSLRVCVGETVPVCVRAYVRVCVGAF